MNSPTTPNNPFPRKIANTTQKGESPVDSPSIFGPIILLIYQPQPVNAANAGAVAVEMKHAYSKLSFLATAGNGYTGAANLTQVQITGGIYATGTLDMVAGTVDPAGTATGALTLAAGEKALVVPMAAKPTLAVTCTIDGEEFTTSITADTMPSLLAGVEYEITLTVIGQEAVISSVKEVPWTTTEVNGGTTTLSLTVQL